MCVKGTCLRCTVSCVMRTFLCPSVRFYCSIWTRNETFGLDQCRINANRPRPVTIICPSPLTYARQRLITASRVDTTCWQFFYIPLSIRPIFIFCCRSYVKLLDYWRAEKSFSTSGGPPEARGPYVAFATSATWLIRHWPWYFGILHV